MCSLLGESSPLGGRGERRKENSTSEGFTVMDTPSCVYTESDDVKLTYPDQAQTVPLQCLK